MKYQHVDGKNKAGAECDHQQEVNINLEAVQVIFPDNHTNKVDLTDTVGLVLKYPTLGDIEKANKIKGEVEKTFAIMMTCVDKVWDADDAYEDFTPKELETFFESMTKEQFEKVSTFFETMPKVSHTFNYVCEGCAEEEEVTIEGLQNFFS